MLLLVFSHSFISAQTPDMPFNIYLKQASLKEFTAKIEQLSEYSFIYGEEVVLKHPITLDLQNGRDRHDHDAEDEEEIGERKRYRIAVAHHRRLDDVRI